jgi:hypothetical protein
MSMAGTELHQAMNRTKMLRDGISFGPFRTVHHERTVDERFRGAFLSYLENRVLGGVEGRVARVEGRVSSHYDDPKHFGPLSVVKFRYHYEIAFHSPQGVETARGDLDYDPSTVSFIETRQRPPVVDSLSAQGRRNDMLQKVELIEQRYRNGEREPACPYCGYPLSIWYIAERDFVKDIRCRTNGCLLVHFD